MNSRVKTPYFHVTAATPESRTSSEGDSPAVEVVPPMSGKKPRVKTPFLKVTVPTPDSYTSSAASTSPAAELDVTSPEGSQEAVTSYSFEPTLTPVTTPLSPTLTDQIPSDRLEHLKKPEAIKPTAESPLLISLILGITTFNMRQKEADLHEEQNDAELLLGLSKN